MCSSCGSSANKNLKRKQQQYAAVNSLEAQSQYDAAINMHTNALSQQRAVKKNKEARNNKKLYR